MTSSRSELYVHFNGRMTYGENGVGYEGNDVKFIQLNNDITFFELERRLIIALQLANQVEDIKITYRYPQVMISPHVNYVPMLINDDEDVEIMLTLLQSTPMLNAAELYVEVESLTVGIVM
ncbi:MULE transposase domain [Fagus crenata]